MTFFLDPGGPDGPHRWTWDYDPALVGLEFEYMGRVNQAMYAMDRVLDLPVDENALRPQLGPDGTVISEHALVGYGDQKVHESLRGWPWDEFRSRYS